MDSTEYHVTIKSATQKVDDYVTKCRSCWTVLKFKEHISETHVNKPRVQDQRLIYAGSILQDSHTLKQIFLRDSLLTEANDTNETNFIIHLVCSTNSQPKTASNHQASSNAHVATPPGAQIGFGAQMRAEAAVQVQTGVRGHHHQPPDQGQGPEQGQVPVVQGQAPIINQPAPLQPEPDVLPIEHDVIDWIYYSIRALVLMAALYAHASMFRLLSIVGLLGIAYFSNRRSASRAQAQQQQQNQNQQQVTPRLDAAPVARGDDAQNPIIQRDAGDEVQPLLIDGNNNDGNQPIGVTRGANQAVEDEMAQQRVPILKLCYQIVTEFLASLVPE